MEAALEYGAAPSLFTKGLPEALPTEAAVPKNWCARSAQGMLFWKEVWSWTKACSKLSRLFFPLDFASLLSRKRWKNTLLSRDDVWEEKQRAQIFTGSLQQRRKHGAVSGIREEHFLKRGRTAKTDRKFLDMLLSSHRDEKQCARSA